MIERETAQQVLALPMERVGDCTVFDYLADLFAAFWNGKADSKYGMTGESSWRYDLYEPLRDAGLIPHWAEGYGVGYRSPTDKHPEDETLADELIAAAITEMARRARQDGDAS